MDWIVEISDAVREAGALTPSQHQAASDALARQGCVLLRGVYTTAAINALRAAFAEQWGDLDEADMARESKRPGPQPILKVGERRYEVLVELKSPFDDVNLLGNRLLCRFLVSRLDPSMKISGVTVVVSYPGAKLQHVHSDHPALFSDVDVSAALPNYAINVAIPLIDVDRQIGPTAIFLGSHVWPKNRPANPEPAIVEFKRGDCILIDYRTQHTGMPNLSQTVRPILYMVYARPWFFDEGNHLARPSLNMSVEQFMALPDDMKGLLSRAYSQRMRGAYLEGHQ